MGGCSSSKEELRQLQKKVALRGDQSTIKEVGNFYKLPKGGLLIPTEIETIKDSLSKRQDIPQFYLLPSTRFDISGGTTLMDFEAIVSYNYFVQNRKTTFLTDEDGHKALRDIFQEAFLGPSDMSAVRDDFPMHLQEKVPDFKREQTCFSWNSNTKKPIQFEDLVNVLRFDLKGEIVLDNRTMSGSKAKVLVVRHHDYFEVIQNGTHVATFKDEVTVVKRSYICYKTIEEDRFELVEGIRIPAEDTYIEEERKLLTLTPAKIAFDPPDFGLTFLGAGDSFDYEDANPGFVIWINQRGILVNPPAYSTDALHKIGVPPTMIDKIILTSAKADHDSGILQKILSSPAIEIITTKTIMASFVRKYAAIIGISCDDLRRLFQFRPVTISHPLILYGATFEFKYTLNSVPSLSFQIEHGGSSLYFSGENLYSPTKFKDLLAQGVFSKDRYKELAEIDWGQFSYILHNAGGEPNFTSLETLQSLPAEVQSKTLVFQISSRMVSVADEESEQSGLQKVQSGLSHTLVG